jgi:hypothetical protein
MPAARLSGAQGHLRIAHRQRSHAPADFEPRAASTIAHESHRAGDAHAPHRRLEQGQNGETTIEEVLRVTQIEEHMDSLAATKKP